MDDKKCGLLKCTRDMYSWLHLAPQVAGTNYFGRKYNVWKQILVMVQIYHRAPKWVICETVRNREFNDVIAWQYKISSDKTSVLHVGVSTLSWWGGLSTSVTQRTIPAVRSYWQGLPCWTGQRVGVRQREIPKLMPEAAPSVATWSTEQMMLEMV